MKSVDEEKEETLKIDVENVVFNLFKAYPNANYIALNTALSLHNQETWKDHWYFIGFSDMPVYQELDGYPEWVADESIHFSENEWGLFFLHISSKDHEYRGVPIQKSRDDFASPRYFCWKKNDDDTLTQFVSEEIEPVDDSKEFMKNFKDMIDTTLLNPTIEALKPRDHIK